MSRPGWDDMQVHCSRMIGGQSKGEWRKEERAKSKKEEEEGDEGLLVGRPLAKAS